MQHWTSSGVYDFCPELNLVRTVGNIRRCEYVWCAIRNYIVHTAASKFPLEELDIKNEQVLYQGDSPTSQLWD